MARAQSSVTPPRWALLARSSGNTALARSGWAQSSRTLATWKAPAALRVLSRPFWLWSTGSFRRIRILAKSIRRSIWQRLEFKLTLSLKFPTRPVPWPPCHVRRASVSSFGYGGSNAHVVLDDAFNYLRNRNLVGYHQSVGVSGAKLDTVYGCATNGRAVNGHSSCTTNGDATASGYTTNGGALKGTATNGKANGANGNGVHVHGDVTHYLDRTTTNGNSTHSGDDDDVQAYAIIPLSAADEKGPSRQAEALKKFLVSLPKEAKNAEFFADLAHTLTVHRSLLNWRAFSVVEPAADAASTLTDTLSSAVLGVSSKTPDLSFVFTGQGAQYAQMGLGLLSYPTFKRSLVESGIFLESLGCAWSVLEELEKPGSLSKIDTPGLSQPLCTAIQVALVDLLRSWDVAPVSVCGHSSGEIAAAYCAGAITRESALKIAYFRGVIAEKLIGDAESNPTTMMSVGLGDQDVLPYLAGTGVSVACVNSPVNVTLSGDKAAVDAIREQLDEKEIFAKRLAVKIAYHSKFMAAGSAAYQAMIGRIERPEQPTSLKHHAVGFYSSVTGDLVVHPALRDPDYWVQNLVCPVQFSRALVAMAAGSENRKQGARFLVELGPQSALRRPIKDSLSPVLAMDKWRYASMLNRRVPDVRSVLEAAGHLWCSGLSVSLEAANRASLHTKRAPRLLVDLPSYPFSRIREYWDESRLSRKYALRRYRRHALLGLREKDWNAAEPSWRHLIRIQENPWIVDHALNGSPLYPGAGMLVMAIEAARQMAAPHKRPISGYRLRNVRFLRAITVDDSERGSEAKIHMHPRKQATNSTSTVWYDWRIYTATGDEWIECAHGSVKAELDPDVKPELAGASDARWLRFVEELRGQHASDAEKCSLRVYHTQLYQNMAKFSGFNYGPYFQQLRNITYDRNGHASADLALRGYFDQMPYASEDPCVIHPTTLDAVCHLQMVALSRGGWQPIPTMMFSHLKDLWVSHKLFTAGNDAQLRAATHETMRSFREAECKTVVLFADSLEPALVAEGQRGTAITSFPRSPAGSEDDSASRMSYGISYQPDLSLLTMQETCTYLKSTFNGSKYGPPPKANVDRGDAISLHFVETVLKQLGVDGPRHCEAHFERYFAWMRRVATNRDKWTLESRGLGHLDIQDVLREADAEPTQRLAKTIGEHLYQILRGEVNALELIFEGRLADDFYHSEMFSLRVLQVGAGTGSSTAQILPYLICDEGNGRESVRFAEYAYSDMSPGFFEKAKDRFSNVAKYMRFQQLDLQFDPCSQGFADGSYDVVVVGNVLHATADLMQTLQYTKKLLRPGGKLIMCEATNLDNIRDGLVFGLLPGWWLREEQWRSTSEEYQGQGPLLTEKQWATVLPESGFSGLDMVFRDHEHEPYHRVSIIVATAPHDTQADLLIQKDATFILIDSQSSSQKGFAEKIQRRLAASTQSIPEIVKFDASLDRSFKDATVISLLEIDGSLLSNVKESEFSAVKQMSLEARLVLWVNGDASPVDGDPEADIALGFGRTVCSERGDQNFVNLSLERPTMRLDPCVESILRVFRNITRSLGSAHENEYSEKDGIIQIPRVVPSPYINDLVTARSHQPDEQTYSVGSNGRKPRFHLSIETPGLLDTLYYIEDQDEHSILEEEYVEIEVRATSLNFKDVMVALGQIPGKGFGLDGAGIVSRATPGSRFTPGDRVVYCSFAGGGLGTFVTCSELQVEKIPDDMAFNIAAAIPTVYSTVVYSIDYVAHLQKGESILIHAGAGGVGQAAIQLAMIRGARIFVTVGSQDKRHLLKDLYGLEDSQIFYSRDSTFAEDVRNATDGHGVDVVLNSLGGELLQQSWDCIAPFGRFVDIGKADIIANNMLPMGPFDRNVTFSAVDLVVIHEKAKPLLKKIIQDVIRLFKEHTHLHEPKPLHVFHPSRLEEAMRFLQGGRNTGKVVVDFAASGEQVKFRPALKPAYHFSNQATYVISGGLGGLGREIIRWMTRRGARNFLALSSSGVEGKPDAPTFIKEVEGMGAKILAPACNITNRKLLENTLQKAMRELPPIKGCIQAAMVLQDDMLMNMSATGFHAAKDPKTIGSWNLHELLPPDMDFFVLLSSFCGVMGNPGQCNYSAGNTFEDALARHRVSRGMRGVSVDLALIVEAGWANDNYTIVTESLRASDGGVKQEQLMAMLDALCDPTYDCQNFAQVVNVIDSPEELYRMTKEGRLAWAAKPMFNNLLRIGELRLASREAAKTDDKASVDYAALVKAAANTEDAGEVVAQGLVQKLAKSLSVPPESLDVQKPAFVLGVDSLIAVEIRYWFIKQLQVEVAVFSILKNQSLVELCQQVAAQVMEKKE
ncbi:Beta-ketoacyl synthase [Macrophomina phaseolina MS6]|uniref:Beta-ketoacyl synthase n=1 Tax=Macrophomina phaseolina (strain MS6) TaxID=1126212 RepID=K2S1K9_MACPH|nr:Beta-ketoacyl synthase [Macrophomina phaseolina MS6]